MYMSIFLVRASSVFISMEEPVTRFHKENGDLWGCLIVTSLQHRTASPRSSSNTSLQAAAALNQNPLCGSVWPALPAHPHVQIAITGRVGDLGSLRLIPHLQHLSIFTSPLVFFASVHSKFILRAKKGFQNPSESFFFLKLY